MSTDDTPLTNGDPPAHAPAAFPPILFENDDLVAVNKPEGLASIPERRQEVECLIRMLEARFSRKLWIIHRLDKEVSGVIVFARNAETHAWMNTQFSTRLVEKSYRALLHGSDLPDAGVIDRPIRQFGSGRMGIDQQKGKACTTEYTVIDRLKGYTGIDAHPITGRRHQIRVHFYSIAHPIVGDSRYGDPAVQRTFPRLMLHAHRIAFQLQDGRPVEIEAPIPPTFLDVLADVAKNRHPVLSQQSDAPPFTSPRSGKS
jgi:tRNA pseudouridine32 synthase / 23S rRNA pseudouridine746 synthase